MQFLPESCSRILPVLMVLASSLAAPAYATSIASPEQVVAMPVAQLAALLEKRWIEQGDHIALSELARAHALAYARKTEAALVLERSPELGWRYYLIDPFADAVEASDARQAQLAYTHVEPAKVFYRMAVAAMPHAPQLRFEYARLLDVSGAHKEAIAQYRLIIEERRQKDAATGSSPEEEPTARWYAGRAAHYLIALLDTEQDQEEIQRLRKIRLVDPG